MTEETKRRWEAHRHRKGRQYIASIPMGWIGATFSLPPSVTKVALAVWYQVKRSRSDCATISPNLFTKFGMHRKTGYRALDDLEAAGLVEVDRQRGRAPRVTIKEPTE